MKLELIKENSEKTEQVIKVRVKQDGDHITIQAGKYGEWNILGLKILDGELRFYRPGSVIDDFIATDKQGRILESL